MSVKLMRWAAGAGDIIELGGTITLTGVPALGAGTASYSLAGGTHSGSTNGGTGDFSAAWITPEASGDGAIYDVRVTINSGSLTGGSSDVNNWLSTGSGPYFWFVLEPLDANLTVEIRRNADGIVLDSVTVILSTP